MALNSIFRKGLSSHVKKIIQIQPVAYSSSHEEICIPDLNLKKIGNREIVGYGLNGEPTYFDKIEVPMPAVRFREDTPEILVVREKEKSDWKKLTMEEKKLLYRASFCQTLAEVSAPDPTWKGTIGYTLILMSAAMWIYIVQKFYVYGQMPDTFKPEAQQAQLQKLIDLRANPVTGIGSKYDYENNRWKD